MGIRVYGAAASAALLLSAAQVFGATITIDEFTAEQRVSDVPGVGLDNASQVPDGSAIGGYRDMEVANDQSSVDGTELRTEGGILGFSNNAQTSGTGLITYDGDDDPRTLNTLGLGGIDLLAVGTDPLFTFDVVNFDAQIFVEITAYDIFGGSSSYNETLPPASSFSPLLPFAAFTGDVDFSSIGALTFFVSSNGVLDLDGAIDSIRVTGTTPVPLPATALLLLGGVGGLSLLRRKKAA